MVGIKAEILVSTGLSTLGRSGERAVHPRNGYPEHFIRWQCSRCYTLSDNQHELTAVPVLLYIYKGSLNQSRKFCRRTLAFKPSSNLLDLWNTSFPIPRTPYLCCWRVELYIEFPIRIMESLVLDRLSEQHRIKEHQGSVVTGNTASNALAEHCWSLYHRVGWEDMTVLHQHRNWFQCWILESWFIINLLVLMNREKGSLPEPYSQLQETTPLLAPPMMQRPVDHIYQWWHLSKLGPVNDIHQIWTLYK